MEVLWIDTSVVVSILEFQFLLNGQQLPTCPRFIREYTSNTPFLSHFLCSCCHELMWLCAAVRESYVLQMTDEITNHGGEKAEWLHSRIQHFCSLPHQYQRHWDCIYLVSDRFCSLSSMLGVWSRVTKTRSWHALKVKTRKLQDTAGCLPFSPSPWQSLLGTHTFGPNGIGTGPKLKGNHTFYLWPRWGMSVLLPSAFIAA